MSVLVFQDFEAEAEDFRRTSPAAFAYLFGEGGRGFGKLLGKVRHDAVEDGFAKGGFVGLPGGQNIDQGSQCHTRSLDPKPDVECLLQHLLRHRSHDLFLVRLLMSPTLSRHPVAVEAA